MTARILLADDDPIMRELAHARLIDAGYEVLIAENGAEAFGLLKQKGADLVISDLDMPVMDGYQLTSEIRSCPRRGETPIIVITASDQAGAVDRIFAAGATSFLAKPINWSLFNHSIKFVLRASDDKKALRIAKDQAETGARFKDTLMSVMSHELRTPLNAIIGFGQLIGDHFEKASDETNREYAEYIVDGGKRLLNSVSDMLLASDARSGPIKINNVDTTVADIMDEVENLASKSITAANAHLKLQIQDPALELCCDRGLVARAIVKLLDNSIKFSQEGVTITVGVAKTRTNGVAFLVRDNGPGISRDKLKEVAVPFTQSDMSIRRSKEGLGLGIPLVQAIAVAHGGAFKMDSELGEGAKALFVLPPARVAANAKSAQINAA